MTYTNILTEIRGRVGLVTLDRPQAMNALNNVLLTELMDALAAFDADGQVNAMVIAGSVKAFAAGADIKEMADKNVQQMMDHDPVAVFSRIRASSSRSSRRSPAGLWAVAVIWLFPAT